MAMYPELPVEIWAEIFRFVPEETDFGAMIDQSEAMDATLLKCTLSCVSKQMRQIATQHFKAQTFKKYKALDWDIYFASRGYISMLQLLESRNHNFDSWIYAFAEHNNQQKCLEYLTSIGCTNSNNVNVDKKEIEKWVQIIVDQTCKPYSECFQAYRKQNQDIVSAILDLSF